VRVELAERSQRDRAERSLRAEQRRDPAGWPEAGSAHDRDAQQPEQKVADPTRMIGSRAYQPQARLPEG